MKRALPCPVPLTPQQFKALAKLKGWTYRAMAARWGMQPESLSGIARNSNRPIRYDDMLYGLPNLNYLAKEQKIRVTQVEKACALFDKKKSSMVAKQPCSKGFRYHDYLFIGSILSVTSDVGSVAEEGMRGVVFDVQRDGEQEIYGVLFDNGLYDWFPPDYVDIYLAGIGLEDVKNKGYRFIDQETLERDYQRQQFNFWPSESV